MRYCPTELRLCTSSEFFFYENFTAIDFEKMPLMRATHVVFQSKQYSRLCAVVACGNYFGSVKHRIQYIPICGQLGWVPTETKIISILQTPVTVREQTASEWNATHGTLTAMHQNFKIRGSRVQVEILNTGVTMLAIHCHLATARKTPRVNSLHVHS